MATTNYMKTEKNCYKLGIGNCVGGGGGGVKFENKDLSPLAS